MHVRQWSTPFRSCYTAGQNHVTCLLSHRQECKRRSPYDLAVLCVNTAKSFWQTPHLFSEGDCSLTKSDSQH